MLLKILCIVSIGVLLATLYIAVSAASERAFVRAFMALSLCLLSILMAAFVLSAFKPLFSLLSLSVWLFVESVMILIVFFARGNRFRRGTREKFDKVRILCVVIFLFFAFIDLFFPYEYLYAGRDPGGYSIGAVRIAETGGWTIEYDRETDEVYSKYPFLRQNGYYGFYQAKAYGDADDYGHIIQQFLPASSSLYAVGYSLGGLFIMDRVNGLIGLIGICLFGLYVYRMTGNVKPGILSSVFLGFSPAYIWNLRQTNSEIILFFLLISALLIFYDSKNKLPLQILGAFILGFTQFVRIDAGLIAVAYIFTEIIWRFGKDARISHALARVSAFTLTTIGACLYSYRYSNPYWQENTHHLKYLYILYGVLFVLFIVLLMLDKHVKKDLLESFHENLLNSYHRVIALFLIAYLVFKYLFVVRSVGRESVFATRALREFTWYTSPFAVILMIVGICFGMKEFEIFRNSLQFIVVGASFFVLYVLYDPYIAQDHLWASRRWVSVAIPFVIVMSVYGIGYIEKRIGANAALVTAVLILGYLLYRDSLFIVHPLMQDLHQQYEAYAEILEDDKVYFGKEAPITAMKFLYGENTYFIEDVESMEEYVASTGESLYYIGEKGEGDVNYEKIVSFALSYEDLEETVGSFPGKIVNYVDTKRSNMDIYYVSPALE